jgi:hypothetical protein
MEGDHQQSSGIECKGIENMDIIAVVTKNKPELVNGPLEVKGTSENIYMRRDVPTRNKEELNRKEKEEVFRIDSYSNP